MHKILRVKQISNNVFSIRFTLGGNVYGYEEVEAYNTNTLIELCINLCKRLTDSLSGRGNMDDLVVSDYLIRQLLK